MAILHPWANKGRRDNVKRSIVAVAIAICVMLMGAVLTGRRGPTIQPTGGGPIPLPEAASAQP